MLMDCLQVYKFMGYVMLQGKSWSTNYKSITMVQGSTKDNLQMPFLLSLPLNV